MNEILIVEVGDGVLKENKILLKIGLEGIFDILIIVLVMFYLCFEILRLNYK